MMNKHEIKIHINKNEDKDKVDNTIISIHIKVT